MLRFLVLALVCHLAVSREIQSAPACRFNEGVDALEAKKAVPTTVATFESQRNGCRTHEAIQEALIAGDLPKAVCQCQQGTYECVTFTEGALASVYFCQQPADMQAEEIPDDGKTYNSGLALGADASVDVIINDGSKAEE